MLTYLRISNFAILDEVELEFGPGLTVLSGETGSRQVADPRCRVAFARRSHRRI